MDKIKKRNTKIQEFLTPNNARVLCARLGNKTPNTLVSGDNQNNVCYWKFSNPKPLCVLNTQTYTANASIEVSSIFMNAMETDIISGSNRGIINIWDVQSQKLNSTLKGHATAINSFAVFPNEELRYILVSGSYDTFIKIWDVRQKTCVSSCKAHTLQINCLEVSPDGNWIVSGSQDGLIKVWDYRNLKTIATFTLHDAPINCVSFNPSNMTLASGGGDKTVKYWDLEKFKIISSSKMDTTPIQAICFSTNGKYLYSAAQESLKSWDMEKDGCLIDNYESNWRGVMHMNYNESDDSIWGINSTPVYFGLWSTSQAATNYFEEQAANRKLISQGRRISTPSEYKPIVENQKNSRAPSVDKKSKGNNANVDPKAQAFQVPGSPKNNDQKRKALNILEKQPAYLNSNPEQRKIHSSGSDSIDPLDRPESRDKRIFINEAQKLLLGGRLSMDYGQGNSELPPLGPKREMQSPSNNNIFSNPLTNEHAGLHLYKAHSDFDLGGNGEKNGDGNPSKMDDFTESLEELKINIQKNNFVAAAGQNKNIAGGENKQSPPLKSSKTGDQQTPKQKGMGNGPGQKNFLQQKRDDSKRKLEFDSSIMNFPQNKPIDLSAGEFLVDKNSISKFDQIDTLNELGKEHSKFLGILQTRMSYMKPIVHWWNSGNLKSALYAMEQLKDPSLVMDALHMCESMFEKNKSVNANAANVALQKVKTLLDSKYEPHIKYGMQFVINLQGSLRQEIIMAKTVPVNNKVDLAREERLKIYDELLTEFKMISGHPRVKKQIQRSNQELKDLALRLASDVDFLLKRCGEKGE